MLLRVRAWGVVHTRALSSRAQYAQHFKTLQLPVTASKSQVRRRYLELAKQLHPDAGASTAEDFSEVDVAYRGLQTKFRDDEAREATMEGEYGLYYQEKAEVEQEDEENRPGINHVIPQHRQYLDNEGIGQGTPAQRQKQAAKYRAFRANEAVFERRMSQLTAANEDRLVTRERAKVKEQHTSNQMERLVEDLIQESMASGAFDNLEGAGKPLPTRPPDYNPYVDFTTHKVNQILVETGFAPEWVEMQKEIRQQVAAVRGELAKLRQSLGAAPLSEIDMIAWEKGVNKMGTRVKDINRMVQKFNLIVPIMNNQRVQIILAKEAEKIFVEGFDPNVQAEKNSETKDRSRENQNKQEGVFSTLFKAFMNKL